MEIITGVERRRHWRVEDKLRIVAEVEVPGGSFAAVARRHEVSRGLLWNWRRQVRRGAWMLTPAPMFLPVQITADPVPRVKPSPVADDASRIEIVLPDGTCVRVGEGVSLAALRRVMAAVRG
jgi:transposase